MSDRVRTTIFGGTFNPIHNGHISIAESIMNSGLTDELWLLVTPRNPWKEGKELMPNDVRLKMAAQAVAHIPGVTASDYEFGLPIPSYTVNTLQNLTKDYPEREFILAIGADNWTAFNKWKDYHYILANHKILVYPRTGSEFVPTQIPGVTYIDFPLIDVSSTMVMERIKLGLSVDGLIPDCVQEELQRMQIYPPYDL